ncbi:SGNH/GDSL hydrolase family protein [Ramlibacter henchirensis]|uniref:SGNH/GDSL hydrolase family protein n=2 Tax=Ramlibacter henchirensis TaxID=204072 RepID=A0A4Z0BS40_9BURK|nr:SGNH/GDSL hydrolase family protein [Ramlibacter henchirensis]
MGALASLVLGACGGGGGGSAFETAATAPAPQASAFAGSSNIAAWGDSHTTGLPGRADVPGYAALLRQIATGRQVFVGGSAGLTSTQIANLQAADNAHDNWVNVFWYGGNNQTQAATIKADLARSIASLAPGNDRYLVLGVTNQATPAERRGGRDYGDIVQLNADLAAQYGDRFFDVRTHLVGLFDPVNPLDVVDHGDDVVPASLRADGVHLNAAGYTAVARRVLEIIVAKGW